MSDNQAKNEQKAKELEAVLFYQAEPISVAKIQKILNINESEYAESLQLLKDNLKNRGLDLVETENKISLVTSRDVSEIIEKIKKEELTKDLSKAALETLAIVLYRSPIKRSDIDYIRGVNSNFILRLLLIRGLIEKEINPNDERGFLYRPTIELLSYLSLNNIRLAPDFEKVNQEIDNFLNQEIKE